MSLIIEKKNIKNFLPKLIYQDFNQDFILCNNNDNIYKIVNSYCLKKTNSSNILNKLIDLENKKIPEFNFDILNKFASNQFDKNNVIFKWMYYIETNINNIVSFYPNNINFYGCCILNTKYDKILVILSYLIKDLNKYNLIICDEQDLENITNFLKFNNLNYSLINNQNNIITNFNIITFSQIKKKILLIKLY